MTKSDFIRSQPVDMTTDEIIKAASAAGINIARNTVLNVRAIEKTKAAARAVAATRKRNAKKARPNPMVGAALFGGLLPPEASDTDAGEILDVDGEKFVRWLEGGGKGKNPLDGAKLLRDTNPALAARLRDPFDVWIGDRAARRAVEFAVDVCGDILHKAINDAFARHAED